MTDLFSHSSVAPRDAGPRPDVEFSAIVAAPMDHAWAGLTEHLHLWWPAEKLSRWGDDSFFDLEDNALVETSSDEDEYLWGEVTDSSQGHWLELRWRHVGIDSATVVRLMMESVSDDARFMDRVGSGDHQPRDGHTAGAAETLTVLRIRHSGWTLADPEELYDTYQALWAAVAERYRRFMGGV